MIIGGSPFYLERAAQLKRCCGPEGCGTLREFERVCVGAECMAWRWRPLLADDAFKDAVIKAHKDLGLELKAGGRHHTKATQHVMDNRAEYGLPEKPFLGYCGLAGEFLT